MDPHPRTGNGAAAGHATPTELIVEDLHKAFDGHRVLRGVDLRIARGDMVAIVGGSGCGKTVLLEHLIGHHQPDRGRVLVADHESAGAPLTDVGELDEDRMDRLRRHWAVVFQRNALFTGTVYENLALWLREVKGLDDEAILPRARRALEAVDLDPDEVLARDRDDLSGGMAKRVAVARALTMDPILLFFDEPTTGLDPQHATQVHALIARTHAASPGRTTVIITHDKDLLHRLEPRVVMLHDGRVLFDGPYTAFRQSTSPVIRPYFELMPALQLRPA